MPDYSYRNFQFDSESLYAHLLNLRIDSPNQVLSCFYDLFIDGTHYPNAAALASLHRMALSPWADQEFQYVLNRSCYIPVNHWWQQMRHRWAIGELIGLLNQFDSLNLPPTDVFAAQRLRELVSQFTQTELFEALQQFAKIADDVSQPHTSPNSEEGSDRTHERVSDLIHRYPFLYTYCLQSWDSSDEGQQRIKQLQIEKEQQFERDLLHYARQHRQDHRSNAAEPPTQNPTLLAHDQLQTAIRQFAGASEANRNYRDSAQEFLSEIAQTTSYHSLKSQLYEYLTTAIHHSCNPKYGKYHFNHWLEDQLKGILPHSDRLKPNGFLLVKTCGQLLDALVANPNRPGNQVNHGVFSSLISNLGATFTVGLLLKITLLCQNVRSNLEVVKSHLARRFAFMFKHYENTLWQDAGVVWLAECLDNWMVASTIHFGRKDFSTWKLPVQ